MKRNTPPQEEPQGRPIGMQQQAVDIKQWYNNLSVAWKKVIEYTLGIEELTTKEDFDQLEQTEQLYFYIDQEYLNELKDLTPVTALKNVRHLYLSGVPVQDISAIRNMNLLSLDLGNSMILDINDVQYLRNLEYLALSNTRIANVRPVSGLSNLKSLRIDYSRVKDLTPLEKLYQLRELNLSGLKIKDVSMLSNLVSLIELNLSNTHVKDVSGLNGLKGLERLYLNYTQVSDITPLTELLYVNNLDLSYTHVKDFSPLSNMKNLEYVNLGHTSIETLNGLHFPNLKTLSLYNAALENLDGVHNFQKLEHLEVSRTMVDDISPVSELLNLKYIYILTILMLPI